MKFLPYQWDSLFNDRLVPSLRLINEESSQILIVE